LENLPFFDIEDEHLVKCDLWIGRLNWPTGSMSCSSWLWIAPFLANEAGHELDHVQPFIEPSHPSMGV
jgi:hypothetical protein